VSSERLIKKLDRIQDVRKKRQRDSERKEERKKERQKERRRETRLQKTDFTYSSRGEACPKHNFNNSIHCPNFLSSMAQIMFMTAEIAPSVCLELG
jgi:hypothetical protein